MEGEQRGKGLDGSSAAAASNGGSFQDGGDGVAEGTAYAAPAADHEADSLCLPASPEFEDPEGWMGERPDYWPELTASRQPTREAWLRGRLVAAWETLRSLGRHRDHLGEATETPVAVWEALFETAVASRAAETGETADVADVADVADAADAADGGERLASAKPMGHLSTGRRRFALDAPRPRAEGPQPAEPEPEDWDTPPAAQRARRATNNKNKGRPAWKRRMPMLTSAST